MADMKQCSEDHRPRSKKKSTQYFGERHQTVLSMIGNMKAKVKEEVHVDVHVDVI